MSKGENEERKASPLLLVTDHFHNFHCDIPQRISYLPTPQRVERVETTLKFSQRLATIDLPPPSPLGTQPPALHFLKSWANLPSTFPWGRSKCIPHKGSQNHINYMSKWTWGCSRASETYPRATKQHIKIDLGVPLRRRKAPQSHKIVQIAS